jgi:hypothetical protein
MQGAMLPTQLSRCVHFGAATGRYVDCLCSSRAKLATFGCALHGECTPRNTAAKVKSCVTCDTSRVEFLPGIVDPIGDPPHGRTDPAWAFRSEVKQRHIDAVRTVRNLQLAPPSGLAGDGIVFVSDDKFHFQAAIAIRVSRHFTSLPIQWWYVGQAPDRQSFIGDLPGVELRSIENVTPRPRMCGGWQMKLVAILNSGFARVLYLDADAYLVGDPSMIFDVLRVRSFLYWQDLDACEKNVRWWGFPPEAAVAKSVPQVQGGHYAVNVAGAWNALVLAHWMDQHSDYFYDHYVYADQDLLRVGIGMTGVSYHVPGKALWLPRAFVVGFPHIRPIIVHRCQGKLFPFVGRNQAAPWLPEETRVWEIFEAMREKHRPDIPGERPLARSSHK